jgi:hypothetical protein
MSKVIKKGVNGLIIEISDRQIDLKKDGKILFSGYEFWDDGQIPSKVLEIMKPGAYAVVRGDTYQGVSKSTAYLIKDGLSEYRNLPEIRLPREREELMEAITTAYDIWESQREIDYNNDIGFSESVRMKKDIKKAEKSLKEFDEKHQEVANAFLASKNARIEQSIQSALNA